MTLTDVKRLNHTDLEAIKHVYFSSFPPEERRPWENVLEQIEQNPDFRMIGIYDEALVGFITVWDLGLCYYVEHFALDEQFRNGGRGSQALQELKIKLPKPIILEVEKAETSAEAQRRIGFYQRNGFTAHPSFDYIQPPYAPSLPAVPLMLMTTSWLDLPAASHLLHQKVYSFAD